MKRITQLLRPEEIVGVFFGVILAMLMLSKRDYLGSLQGEVATLWNHLSVYFSALGVLAIFMRSMYEIKNAMAVFRDWLPFFISIIVYELLHGFVNIINPNDQRELLIKIDYFIFNVHPTVWLERFIHPALTAYLTIAYLFYFFFVPILAIILYFKLKFFEFRVLMLTVLVCMYIAYLGYLLVPALPPYIAQSNLYTLTLGGAATEKVLFPLMETASVLRGCFPSLHTALTTIVLFFAYRYEPKLFWLMLPFGLSLFVATVYLRQHYVIDLIAGWVLAGCCIYFVPRFHAFWERDIRDISGEMRRVYKVDEFRGKTVSTSLNILIQVLMVSLLMVLWFFLTV